MGTDCQKQLTEEAEQWKQEAEERARQEEANDRGWEEYAKEMPAIERENERWDKEEAQSKEDLVRQSEEAKHIEISANPDDFPKAVPAIPIKGFDSSEIISDAEVKERIKDDPMMQVYERFFPGRLTSIENNDERPIMLSGEKTEPVSGRTIPNPQTGEKQVVIYQHHFKDAPRQKWITEREYKEKKDSPEEQKAIKKEITIATICHETRTHVFGQDMLGEESQDKLETLFKEAKEREKQRGAKGVFVSPYAGSKDKWEYLGEGAAWYSEPKHREQLARKDPALHNYLKKIEDECKSFLRISKKLILVRRRS